MRRGSEHPPPPLHPGCDSKRETEHKKHKRHKRKTNTFVTLVLFVFRSFYFTPAAGFRTRRLNSCSSSGAKITSNSSWSGEFFPCSLKVRVSLVQGLE